MGSVMDPILLRAILRKDFMSFVEKVFQTLNPTQTFVPSWYLEAIAWHLEQCRLGHITRLLITVPPRHLKSVSASVAFPAFILGHDPTARIVASSYSMELATKFARDTRAVMNTLWYRQLFPGTRFSRERNADLEFMTSRRGYRLTTSTGATLTGRGGNMIIIDDPMKPEEAMSQTQRAAVANWFDNTLYTRQDDKRTDCIIIVMQRLHQEDLIGHVLSKGDDWVHLDLPAIAEVEQDIQIGPDRWHRREPGGLLQPVREPLSVLNKLKVNMGSFHFAAQYQQRPIPEDGEILKWSWFRTYETEPSDHDAQVVQSWDTASKAGELNDYSVCTTWLIKDKKYYLLDVFRQKLDFPELRRAIIELAQQFEPYAILIEDKASGMALLQQLEAERSIRTPIAIEPHGDKITRASGESPAIEAGDVLLPTNAPWLTDFRNEISQFPNGRHDDQVDSMTQMLHWHRTREEYVTNFTVTFAH